MDSGDINDHSRSNRINLFITVDFFFFQAEDGIRDLTVTGVQTCALPILALLLLAEPFGERVDLRKLHALDTRGVGELRLELEPEATVLMLADHLRLVEGPLIGGLLLGEEHLLHRVVSPERRDRQDHGIDRRREGDATAEMLLAPLLELLGVRQLELRHVAASSPCGFPRASRPCRPRRRSGGVGSAPRRAPGSCRATRRRAPAPRSRTPAPSSPRHRSPG